MPQIDVLLLMESLLSFSLSSLRVIAALPPHSFSNNSTAHSSIIPYLSFPTLQEIQVGTFLISDCPNSASLHQPSWNPTALFHSGRSIKEPFHSSLFVRAPIWVANAAVYANHMIPTMAWFWAQQTGNGGTICYSKRDPARDRLIAAWQKTTAVRHHAISALQGEYRAD